MAELCHSREEGEMGMGLIPPAALLHPLGTLSSRLQPERQGLMSSQAIAEIWPLLGSVGLSCVLQPLPQSLSSDCACFLPNTVEKLPEEKKQTYSHFHRNAQVLADFPAWAGPAIAAQASTDAEY